MSGDNGAQDMGSTAGTTPGQQQQDSGQQRQGGDYGSHGQQGGGNPDTAQQQQFAATASDQQGAGGQDTSQFAGQVREHMEVIGADGVHVGTVDHIDGGRIKLTKADSGMGGHQGHHHYISTGLIAGIEGDKVRLSASGANAVQFEEEQ